MPAPMTTYRPVGCLSRSSYSLLSTVYLQAGRLLEPLELPDPSMAPLPRPGGGRYLRVPSRPSDLERRSGCGPNSTACAVLALHWDSNPTPTPNPNSNPNPNPNPNRNPNPNPSPNPNPNQALHRESDSWKAGLRMPVLSYRRVASTNGLYVVPNVYREHAVDLHYI
eukprot:scaffold97761_cov57-Phaeocystis_antarctica.AAC.1